MSTRALLTSPTSSFACLEPLRLAYTQKRLQSYKNLRAKFSDNVVLYIGNCIGNCVGFH
ncbi:hypothetical protein EC991_004738 [Linnemannia zychae]|nr:hypothetical protein EC991_004738 [Linnemannia zychae]